MTGAAYAPLAQHFRLPPVAGGIAYGLGVWASSYLGWLPATGLYRSPGREPKRRHAMMIGAHAVWGAVLGVLTDLMLDDAAQEHSRAQSVAPRKNGLSRSERRQR